MKYSICKSDERGTANFGWFKARYSFSFGQYHNPQRMGFGKLRVFNDSIIQPGKGFPEHPHDNFEIITIQFQGDLEHTDISGTRNIRANDVQAITAGTGVTHSDINISSEEAKQFQIWIEPNTLNTLPKSRIAHFKPKDWLDEWKVLVGPLDFDNAPLKIQQNAYVIRGKFGEGRFVEFKTNEKGNGLFLIVIDGVIEFQNVFLEKRDTLEITDIDSISIKLIEDSDILIIEVPM